MSGPIPPSIVAEALLIMAWRFLLFLAPIVTIAALWWLANRTDRIIGYFYPDLEWEQNLGWLNIRAEQRANAALRWLGYGIYLLLGGALYGIAWAAVGLQDADKAATEPLVMADLMFRVPVLIVCLAAWVLFLGSWLIPKLKTEREEAELKRFRVEMDEKERERETNPRSRVKSPLRKPRTNKPLVTPGAKASPFGNRSRYWREPGG